MADTAGGDGSVLDPDSVPEALAGAGLSFFFDPAMRLDPYPAFKFLQENVPVFQTPLPGLWIVSRYNECNAILRDQRWSSDDRRSNAFAGAVSTGGMPALPEELEGMQPFLFMDPPDHTRLRGLVAKAFTPRVVESLRPRIQQVVDELLAPALAAGGMDVIADLAYPLPVTIISEMLGVPVEDKERFTAWSRELAASLDPSFGPLDPVLFDRRISTQLEFVEYFRGLIAHRRAHPQDDLLSALVAVEEAGDTLSEKELLSTCILLLVAGHETTVNLIGNGALCFARHPDQLAKLRSDAGLARSAVEEVLRFDPPVQLTGRAATEDLPVGDHIVPKGDMAITLIGAANRDPAQFEDPDRFDVTRNDARHLAFGFGAHFCLGAPLARAEGQAALGELALRTPGLRVLADPPEYKENLVLRGLASLPVEFSAS
ncbi:MAG TPA: cytochrome P450 [Acidimicrobiales bacterium]|nr:cytochrome P450 [Acidimicrobiales bacterium]